MRRFTLAVALVSLALAAGGCSTVKRINPFHGPKGPSEVAGDGQRISIVADDEKVEVAEGLKGADFFLPEPTALADWPLPGGTLSQSVAHVDAGHSLSVAWRRGFGEASKRGKEITAPPVMAAGKVFVMDGEATVSAINASNGEVVWRKDLRPSNKRDREAFGGGLAFADGKLYVTSGYRFAARLDANSGAVEWKKATDEPIHAAPTVASGVVMAVSIDNTLLTFNAETGDPGWNYQALSEPARILAASSPAVSGDTVVASFGSGELVALRVANGIDLWSETLSRANRSNALSEIRDIPGRPVIYEGDVFAVSHSGVFAVTDLRTGSTRWTLPIAGITSPWVAGDVVYVVSRDGKVYCVARESGQVYWIKDLNAGLPVTKKRAFGLFGKKVVRPVWSSPLLASNRLIIGSSAGQLVALNPKTGEIEKSENIGAPVLIGPIAAGGMIYIATDKAQLVALK
ncbi:PQQ-binding-like beta-propeller repeat protein [Phenylobacterium sp.]|uniref:outer membrane protein assembly factor BamB family protein n=1 Tax=Phenylobacterium sp. TaxID=1871053 RepID=UPI0035B31306